MMKLFVIAGEKSGDNLGGNLVAALRTITDAEVSGTGGSLLKSLGQKQFYDINDMNAIGLGESLRKVPFLFKVKDRLIEEIKNDRPDAVVLVDYPGFNLRFARYIKEMGIPVIYYVSPTFWVWNYKRVRKLKAYCDLVLCIYPFEPEILQKEGVNAVYTGNPLRSKFVFKCENRSQFLEKGGFKGEKRLIGLLPGSRKREVESLLPVMVQAAKSLPDYDYVVGVADTIDETRVRQLIKGTNIRIATGLTHDIMKHCDLLWVCSGTATLESAIIGTPMILLYKTGFLTWTLGKLLVRVKFVGMPNIIMKKAVIPELLQEDATALNLIKFTEKLEQNSEQVKADLAKVSDMFPDTDASLNAASEIYSFISSLKKGK